MPRSENFLKPTLPTCSRCFLGTIQPAPVASCRRVFGPARSWGIGLAWLTREVLRSRRERSGLLLSTNFADSGGFIKSDAALTRTDLQLHFEVGLARFAAQR